MECEIYIEQPEGYEVKSQSNEKLVYKLEKSLYGLKQADTGMESFCNHMGWWLYYCSQWYECA